jgi:hypothetical protein
LNVAAEVADLARVPSVDRVALRAGGLDPQPVGVDNFTVQDHVRPALDRHTLQGFVQVRGLGGEHADPLVEVAVRGG